MPAPRPLRPNRTSSLVALATIVALVASFTVLPPLSAAARPAERNSTEQRELLMRLLADTNLELDRRILAPIGDDVPHQLVLIADLPRVAPIVRVRAVAALAYFPNATTQRYLTSILGERGNLGTDLGTRLRQQALRSLAVGFRGEAVEDILTLRRDREPLIRQSVANALKDAGDPRVLPVLEQWLGAEPVITVRAAIDDAISTLRGR
ncbi:MAG: hypothetical protein CVU56_14275 [Deltaproteobacteria bacterium HGW-Deltaproteobacteria-14]|jgi:HEAT repeat protein|nr:MAG: hypothetical protein CVU56_14275 [Deltaproteobacteria bacterium HGW-Deltaproteobacteria-14]